MFIDFVFHNDANVGAHIQAIVVEKSSNKNSLCHPV